MDAKKGKKISARDFASLYIFRISSSRGVFLAGNDWSQKCLGIGKKYQHVLRGPESVCEAEKAISMWHSRWASRNVYGMVNEQKGGKFIVPSGASGDGKYASQLSFLFSLARLAHLVGKKANGEEERWWRRRRKSFGENSFSHGHTHHHELHTCRPKTGSWGSDLWPLCRVPPFNNQWSWRANFPFYFSHIRAIVMSLHFHPPPLDPHHKNALFTAFRGPTDCIQFSNLNRDVRIERRVEILMETHDRKSRSAFAYTTRRATICARQKPTFSSIQLSTWRFVEFLCCNRWLCVCKPRSDVEMFPGT